MHSQSSHHLKDKGGPLHYLGNRNLSLPDVAGRMTYDPTWLNQLFSIIYTGKKFKRCFEPFAGCASFSFAAMEREIAEEYVINDSDSALITTHRLMRNDPERIKHTYASLIEASAKAASKKDFFLSVMHDYNRCDEEKKALLLPFIINHSWSGIVFHDDAKKCVYREAQVNGKTLPGYFEKATLSLEDFSKEVDRISNLLKRHKVTFLQGDFLKAIATIEPGDFLALNPPYPENARARVKDVGMYVELQPPEQLYQNLVKTLQNMEAKGIEYYMTYGFHDPEMKQFVIKDASQGKPRHFLRILGFEGCAWGIGLDQMYFSSKLRIPKELASVVIAAQEVLQNRDLTAQEALLHFQDVAKRKAVS